MFTLPVRLIASFMDDRGGHFLTTMTNYNPVGQASSSFHPVGSHGGFVTRTITGMPMIIDNV